MTVDKLRLVSIGMESSINKNHLLKLFSVGG